MRYGQKCILVFTWRTLYSCQILIEREFFGQIFDKYSNTKFHENPSIGSQVVPCGQTDGRTYMKKLTVAFRNFAKATKKSEISREYSTHEINDKCWKTLTTEAKIFWDNIKVYLTSTNEFCGHKNETYGLVKKKGDFFDHLGCCQLFEKTFYCG